MTSLNFSSKLTENCEIISGSCTSIKPYNTYEITSQIIDLRSSVIVQENKFNLCDKKKQKSLEHSLKSNMISLGIPFQCKAKKAYINCSNSSVKYELSTFFQRMMPMFGRSMSIKVITRTKHDTGTSCIEVEAGCVKKSKK
jgi:hypothetical protein